MACVKTPAIAMDRWPCHEAESNRLLANFGGTRSRYAIVAVCETVRSRRRNCGRLGSARTKTTEAS